MEIVYPSTCDVETLRKRLRCGEYVSFPQVYIEGIEIYQKQDILLAYYNAQRWRYYGIRF